MANAEFDLELELKSCLAAVIFYSLSHCFLAIEEEAGIDLVSLV